MNNINPEKLYQTAKNDFGLQQIPQEWIEFIKFLDATRPKVVLEIGTFSGGSAYTFSHFSEAVISVDCNNRLKPKRIKLIGQNTRFIFINKASDNPKVLKKIKRKLAEYGGFVDLLFIDGEHTYKGARNDFVRFSPLVRSDGHIVLHDILKSDHHIQQGCLVFKFWEELKAKFPNAKEIIRGRKWGGIGIIKV